MGEPTPDTPVSASGAEDRLDSWKEIAAYLNRDVTTVQRWEKGEGMPVHRHLHDKMGSVYASSRELDAWASSRKLRTAQEKDAVLADDSAGRLGMSTPIRARRLVALLLAVAALLIIVWFWLEKSEYFWRNPIADARFETITNFDGVQQGAAISRDGHFVAFLSNRDGNMDIWVTQIGSGQFHNLTQGNAPELVNPAVRELAFSPDSSLVTYWGRKPDSARVISVSSPFPRLAASPKRILRALPSTIGRATDRGWLTTHRAQETRYTYRTEAVERWIARSSPRLPDHMPIFSCGRRTSYTSTSFKVRCPTSSISGGYGQWADPPSELPRTTAA